MDHVANMDPDSHLYRLIRSRLQIDLNQSALYRDPASCRFYSTVELNEETVPNCTDLPPGKWRKIFSKDLAMLL